MQTTFSELTPNVSRETFEKLEHYVRLIEKWNPKINLISQSDSSSLWDRHILDSYQLTQHLPETLAKIMDIGSGGGFPAIVIAITTSHHITMVESDRRKAIFLDTVIRELQLSNAAVVCSRIEKHSGKADVITARALATVEKLLKYSEPFLSDKTYCLFPKGKNWNIELEKAKKNWYFSFEILPSATSDEGKLIKISHIKKH